ncbi:MAG TPA: NADP-dependent oxidoreductase [Puia sp.]|nr:NADP-dependent oxidoreductase [Puia sp.]
MVSMEKDQPDHTIPLTMKAIRMHGHGDSGVLLYEDAPVPSILPDEVLVKIHSAGVNPVDWKIRSGYGTYRDAFSFPLIPGWDVAGTIARVGSLVKTFKAGDQVIARPEPRGNGAYAEYAAVRGFEVAHAPLRIPLQEAAGIPLAAQTAWMGIFEKGNLQQGQRILIHGASGGVGIFAVQFARIANAHVIATTSAKNIQLVKSLGADEVIDYKEEDFSEKVSDIDLVFDPIGGDTQARSWKIIRKGGVLVSSVGTDQHAAKQFGVRTEDFRLVSNGSRLQEISTLVDAGLVRVIIAKEFPLQEAKAAQDLSETGHVTGKIILRVE